MLLVTPHNQTTTEATIVPDQGLKDDLAKDQTPSPPKIVPTIAPPQDPAATRAVAVVPDSLLAAEAAAAATKANAEAPANTETTVSKEVPVETRGTPKEITAATLAAPVLEASEATEAEAEIPIEAGDELEANQTIDTKTTNIDAHETPIARITLVKTNAKTQAPTTPVPETPLCNTKILATVRGNVIRTGKTEDKTKNPQKLWIRRQP